MFETVLMVLISVILAGATALICVDHDATSEIVNWRGGQRSTL